MSVVEIEDLSVVYGRRRALDGVSLRVEPGAVFALLGRNGAGKSSLVRCAIGAQRPAGGGVRLLGRNVWRERASILADVGVVPEEPDAPPAMTARQLFAFSRRLYPRWDGAGAAARLDRFGVPADLPFGRLSKGQKGQVAITLAFAQRPALLILDDPTLGLDPLARRAVFAELIGELADRGTTVFLTTHDLDAVEGIADHVGILAAGRLVLAEELESLKRRFRRLSSAGGEELRGAEVERLAPLGVGRRAFQTEAVVSRFDEANAGKLAAEAVEVSSLSLEEIFLAVAGEPQGANP